MAETAMVKGPLPTACVHGLTKQYRGHAALTGVDLNVPGGELSGLIGPDGAGKSSLLKAIAGLLYCDAGTVTVFGEDTLSDAGIARIRDRIGFMPQGLGLNLYPALSVEENVDFFAQVRLVPPAVLAARKRQLLGMTRLDRFKTRPMKNLSGGMKQKLGLVCTLIHEPAFIILDEPTTGVDPVSRREFWDILAELIDQQHMTALVSTAYMDEASRFDVVNLMFDGHILAQGTPEMLSALAGGCLVTVRAEPPLTALDRARQVFPQVTTQGADLRIFLDQPEAGAARAQVCAALQPAVTIRQLTTAAPDLEEIFIALLRRREAAAPPAPSRQETPPALSRQAVQGAPGKAPVPGSAAAIEALALSRDFGAFRAVDQVSFSVRPGEIFGLLGANGAGKTTVIKMLTGLLPPSSGQGFVAGVDMRRAGQAIKERIGYMSQAFSLYQDLTVRENIRLYASIYGLSPAQTAGRLEWILTMGDLRGHEADAAGRLPMGLRQRLALGCALVHRPRVLFLDEPTSGVDPIGRRQFWDILYHLSRQEEVAILVTTHYMSEAEHCDHLVLMYAGRVVADATPEQMKQETRRAAGELLEIQAAAPHLALRALKAAGYGEAALFGKFIHLLTLDPAAARPHIDALLARAGTRLLAVTRQPLSMEDVFVYRVRTLEQQEPIHR